MIVAGPNGSGKSSAYQDADIETFARSVWIINPDVLAARIRDTEKLAQRPANIAAVERIERWLETSIEAYQTVGVETVLSTDKYRRLVSKAKSFGFDVRLIYVVLDSPRRNVERVRLRVQKGGHAAPEDKIVERYHRSLAQMPWFLNLANRAWLFDNSGASPRLIGQKLDDTIELDPQALPNLREAIEMASSSQHER